MHTHRDACAGSYWDGLGEEAGEKPAGLSSCPTPALTPSQQPVSLFEKTIAGTSW